MYTSTQCSRQVLHDLPSMKCSHACISLHTSTPPQSPHLHRAAATRCRAPNERRESTNTAGMVYGPQRAPREYEHGRCKDPNEHRESTNTAGVVADHNERRESTNTAGAQTTVSTEKVRTRPVYGPQRAPREYEHGRCTDHNERRESTNTAGVHTTTSAERVGTLPVYGPIEPFPKPVQTSALFLPTHPLYPPSTKSVP